MGVVTWVDVVVWLGCLGVVVLGVLVWFGAGPALVAGGVLGLVAHWLLTDGVGGG